MTTDPVKCKSQSQNIVTDGMNENDKHLMCKPSLVAAFEPNCTYALLIDGAGHATQSNLSSHGASSRVSG